MKILITEDDPLTLEALGELLAMEGFSVTEARNGKEALECWKREPVDLVCLDIMMPEMDGYEACRQLRKLDRHVPILFLSAKQEEMDVVVGLELGADDFIRKPFTSREVMARIRAVLRRAYPGREQRVLKMGELIVWPEELRAEKDGQAIELSPREARMLALLEEKKNCPVSRDEFLDRCWGIDYFPDSRTLDQHVHVLRKKIGDGDDGVTIIETVRGVGYRFRES